MQWAYAAFDKSAPTGEPVVWDPLTMFDRSKEEVYFDQMLQSRRQVLVLFKNDFSFSEEEKARLLDQYEIDQSYRFLTLLRLKR
jgi:hypothetical protein